MSTGQKKLDLCQHSAVARLFSPTIIRELATKGRSPLFSKLLLESRLLDSLDSRISVGAAFDMAFSYLKKKAYRTEYTYKAAIANKLLLGRHSLNTASLISEFRIENCKADIAIFNGTSTVYEIKSERDKLQRLNRQLSSYEKMFAKIYVVIGQNHIDEILKITPQDTGILVLNDRHSISTIREASECPEKICPITICSALQAKERIQLLEDFGIKPPDVPNTEMYRATANLFSQLDPKDVHDRMVKVIRESRKSSALIDFIPKVPKSLTAAVLAAPPKEKDRPQFMGAINTPVMEALYWA